MSTDIIIISYNDKEELEKTITSIKAHCIDYILIVEDNNSPNKNRGFTKAVNDGIKSGKSDFIWLINSDAEILEGAQDGLIHRLESHPKVGIAGSMQIDPDDHDIVRHAGTLRCFPAGAHKGGRLSMGHCRIPSKETWVNFASAMVKRSVYEDVGPMDEKMFLLYSDSSYCFSIREAGYECWYEPSSRVLHRLGKASKSSSEWQQKDMLAFMEKWGIKSLPDGRFEYSRRFQKLDMFP